MASITETNKPAVPCATEEFELIRTKCEPPTLLEKLSRAQKFQFLSLAITPKVQQDQTTVKYKRNFEENSGVDGSEARNRCCESRACDGNISRNKFSIADIFSSKRCPHSVLNYETKIRNHIAQYPKNFVSSWPLNTPPPQFQAHTIEDGATKIRKTL